MANIVNERDRSITESAVRVLPTGGDYIYLSSSAQYFKVDNDGISAPSEISVTANLVGNLSGTCTFTILEGVGAGTLDINGNTATLLYSNMFADNITIRASLERLNNTYTADLNITKLENGTIGTSGDSVDIIFKRSSVEPDIPLNSEGTPPDWYSTTDSVPVNTTQPLWSSIGTKTSGQNIYVWQKPTSIEGGTIAEISIFKRSDETLTAPTGGSYSFTTKTTTPPSGWSTGVPSGSSPVYLSRAVASIFGTTGEDSSLSWSTPSISFQSSVVLSLISDADVVATNSSGLEYLLPTGNFLRLYVGNVLQQTGVTFGGTTTKGGLTLTVNPSSGAITLSGNTWGTSQESFVLTASYAGVVYEILYSITKAVAGSSTTIPDLVSGTDVVYANSDGTGYTLPSGNSMKLYTGSDIVTTGVVYSGTTTKNGLTATIDNNTGQIVLTGTSWTSNSETFTFTATYASISYTAIYSISKARAGAAGAPGAPGTSTIVADLSSETGLVSATSDGVLTGTLPSGVSVSLYSGSLKITSGITYDVKVGSSSGTQTATEVTKTHSGLVLTLNKATGNITFTEEAAKWTSDTVTFTIALTYASVVYSVNYTLSKLKAGSSVIAANLVGGDSVVVPSNSAGTEVTLPPASDFQIFKGDTLLTSDVEFIFEATSTSSGQYAGYWYRTQNGLTLFLNKATGNYFFVVQVVLGVPAWNTNTETFKLIARYDGVDYKKSLAITKVKSADSSVSVMLASEADVVSANSSGGGYILPTGNTLKLFVGADWVTSGVTYGGGATKNGLTLAISSAGNITLTGASWTTTQESFSLTAVYNGITYTKIFTISKSVAGSDVVLMDLTAESQLVSANSDGTGYAYPSGNQIILYRGGSTLTSGIVYGISGGTTASGNSTKTQNGLTLTVNTATGSITLSGTTWTSNQETYNITATYSGTVYYRSYTIAKARAGVSGAASIVLDLKSDSDVVFADSDGGSYTYPTGNALRLYIGSLQQTSGITYSGTITKSGLTATINSTTGVITLTGAQWTSNQESFDFTATYAGVAYTATYIITKARQGSPSVLIDLLSETDVVFANTDGSGYILPSGNEIRLYKGAVKLTSGVVYGGSVDNRNGLKIAVNTSTGAITLSNATGLTWTSNQEFFDLTASYSNTVYSVRYSITKSKTGANGVSITGNSVRIAYSKTTLSTLATTPLTITTSGNTSYPPNSSWGTGTVWGGSPLVLTAGQSLYQSNGIYNSVTDQTIWDVPYLSNLKVGSLSAISADLGTITAGNISGASLRIGTAPAVSGTTMSGTGLQINTSGTFAMGNNSTNLSFNGERLTLNGDIVTAANIQQGAVTYINTAFAQTTYYYSTDPAEVEYSVLDLDAYFDGSQVTIIGDVESQFGTIYKIGSNSYGRSWSYRVAWKPFSSAYYNTISFQTASSAAIKFAYVASMPAGYNRVSLLVREAAIPATGVLYTRGLLGLRHMNVVQTKR